MARARGANALLAAKFETIYGTPPGGNYAQLPFVSSNLGAEQGLIESDLLGQGREPYDPTPDVIVNDGDVVVPVDARAFGYWLKLAFGDAVVSDNGSASGYILFSAQPAAASTLNINGVTWTFVASGATGNQVNIGANLSATMTALAAALNGSSDPDISVATYAAVGGTKLTISYDTPGIDGDDFTLAVSPTSNATRSGTNLTGGTQDHVWTSGGALPSMAIEIGNPEVPSYAMNFGAKLNQLKLAMARSGLLNATLSLICQGESRATSTAAGTPVAVEVARFAQAVGQIKQNGSVLGNVVSAELTYSNNLDKIEVIRADGMIAGADEAMSMLSASLVTRFDSTALLDLATSDTPVDLSFGWTNGAFSLLIDVPRVFLPPVKRPITGPAGIQATFNPQASAGTGGHVCTVTLTNDQAAY